MDNNASSAKSLPLLTDYLLVDSPAHIVFIGSQSLALRWPEATTGGPVMMSAESVEQAEQALVQLDGGRDEALGSCVALLELDCSGGDAASKATMEMQLGRAVRLFSARLIVYTRSLALADSALFAFGFHKLAVTGPSTTEDSTRWFEYRLSHYKPPPEWLNARFWANPERFETSEDDDIYYDPDEEE